MLNLYGVLVSGTMALPFATLGLVEVGTAALVFLTLPEEPPWSDHAKAH